MSSTTTARPMGEEDLVRQLLGREPKLPYVIVSRCPGGTPQVLQADPIFFEDGRWKPFPSYLWLVCPRLKHAVAKLEQEGFIQMFTRRLRDEPQFRDEFLAGHQEMVSRRLEMASHVCPAGIPIEVEKILRTATIAGSRHLFGVKCLHAHLAQALVSDGNPIGMAIRARIGDCSPDQPCVPAKEGGHKA